MRSLIELELYRVGDPKSVVERAVQKKRESETAAKRQRDSYLAYDRVWCVFDVDQHARLADAIQQARDNEIGVAVSNPCFELWALLHFQDQNAHITRSKVQSLCRKHIPHYEKELPCAALWERYSEARERAVKLDHWHQSRGTSGGNPSTGVYRLIAEIEAEKQG